VVKLIPCAAKVLKLLLFGYLTRTLAILGLFVTKVLSWLRLPNFFFLAAKYQQGLKKYKKQGSMGAKKK